MTEAAQPVRMFRKGLSLKNEVADELTAHYHSTLVDEVRTAGYQRRMGRLQLYLASEFGFCYGVDRAVDYAYQARRRFPDRSIYLTGEIIHNPRVNDRLRDAGIRFLDDAGEDERALGPDDVVILPAFGVTVSMLLRLQQRGCTLVDTTCGSVLNVWKNVRQYARDGFTAIIHGKVRHEETVATASQALQYPDGRSLVVFDRTETGMVCDFIRRGGDASAFLSRFSAAASPRLRPPPGPAADRPGQPDHHVDVRVSRHRRDDSRGRWSTVTGTARSSTGTTGLSTPSAARRRTARTPSRPFLPTATSI